MTGHLEGVTVDVLNTELRQNGKLFRRGWLAIPFMLLIIAGVTACEEDGSFTLSSSSAPTLTRILIFGNYRIDCR